MNDFIEINDFPNYLINKEGVVYSKISCKIMKPSLMKTGYVKYALRVEEGVKYPFIHRLLALQFIDNPNNFDEIDHIDKNRQNNCLDNLRWVDRQNNAHNRIKRGRIFLQDNLWIGRIQIENKKYQKKSIDKKIVEDWLEQYK